METERNAQMQATQIHERGGGVVSWGISPRVHPYFKHFAFLFLDSSWSYHICHRHGGTTKWASYLAGWSISGRLPKALSQY